MVKGLGWWWPMRLLCLDLGLGLGLDNCQAPVACELGQDWDGNILIGAFHCSADFSFQGLKLT